MWSLSPVRGDCEDYAITKRHELIAAGWPVGTLRLAIAYTPRGLAHMVLLVETSGGDLVLDNLTEEIRDWKSSGLRWKMIQSGENPRKWYRV